MALIEVLDGSQPGFHLRGEKVSYAIAITAHGHVEHLHFGAGLGPLAKVEDLEPLRIKHPEHMAAVAYTPDDPGYFLDAIPLDHSGLGKGDYRLPGIELKQPDGTFVTDFRYVSHAVTDEVAPASDTLPTAHDGGRPCATLELTLADGDLTLTLWYTVFPDSNTITRRAVLTNNSPAKADPAVIRRLMSQQIDLPNRAFDLVTFDGAWISEARKHVRPVMPGVYVNASLTGFSSHRHNPGVLLATRGASENHGEVYGFNLVYSGNHYTAVELSARELVRVMSGINPTGFEWTLPSGESFETPEAVLSWSDAGFNGLSENLHAFVGHHIVRGEWAEAERPILVNNWEATYFSFDHGSILGLARQAKKLGAELVVLDDGWFVGRDSDTAGLGDYAVNRRKLPKGVDGLADDIRALGLSFGLWVEPEMVNRDSDLFRAHPDWALTVPGRTPSEGRHQLVLDLTQRQVRDYIVAHVSNVVDAAQVSYVKWDCNRSLSDLSSSGCAGGEVAHRYILGLYEVLGRIFGPRPHILLESCASGGGRFDLGMLCFGPQVWTSDCTDPIERLDIQLGLSYLYPQSTMGAHVTASPSAQTLRDTPLSTRFNVAALGLLGYELDPGRLSPAERRETTEQVEFYKRHRRLLQYGRLRRYDAERPDQVTVSVSDAASDTHVVGHYQTRAAAARPPERLPLPPLTASKRYRVSGRHQSEGFERFGHLAEHVLPAGLRADGLIMRQVMRYVRRDEAGETFEGPGAVLGNLQLLPQYEGQGAENRMRILGDHGSRLYVVAPAAEDVW